MSKWWTTGFLVRVLVLLLCVFPAAVSFAIGTHVCVPPFMSVHTSNELQELLNDWGSMGDSGDYCNNLGYT